MIRPRGGDFIYSDEEFNIMLDDIEICKSLKAQEIITGILDNQNKIDIVRMNKIIEFAKPLQIIFHMAIDDCNNYDEGIQTLIQLGIKRVLTKGGKFKNAIEGKEILRQKIQQYQNIVFLCGGGITKDNYQDFIQYTKCQEIHGTKLLY